MPEVVFFVFAGAIVGPNCLGLVNRWTTLRSSAAWAWGFSSSWRATSSTFASSPGAMGQGRAVSWAVSFSRAGLLITPALGLGLSPTGTAAFAIALTTTAYGTLVPIMRDRGLGGTRVGRVVVAYGAMGEILPVLAMSLLLSPHRSTSMNLAVLAGFFVLCLVVAVRAAAGPPTWEAGSLTSCTRTPSGLPADAARVVPFFLALLALADA